MFKKRESLVPHFSFSYRENSAPPNKRKDFFVVNRRLGLPIEKDMGLFGLGITVPNSMIFDLVPLASIYRKILLSN